MNSAQSRERAAKAFMTTRSSGLAPTLQSKSTDKTEQPTFALADRLKLGGNADQFNHFRAAINQRCCSTSPEVGFGALGGTV
jgi:hypothetical protein